LERGHRWAGGPRMVAAGQGKLVVHAWGKCFPTGCDWRQADASLTEGGLPVLWSFGFSSRTWKLSPESDGRLELSEHTHYMQKSTPITMRSESLYLACSRERDVVSYGACRD
jgi:hypothetical protein